MIVIPVPFSVFEALYICIIYSVCIHKFKVYWISWLDNIGINLFFFHSGGIYKYAFIDTSLIKYI